MCRVCGVTSDESPQDAVPLLLEVRRAGVLLPGAHSRSRARDRRSAPSRRRREARRLDVGTGAAPALQRLGCCRLLRRNAARSSSVDGAPRGALLRRARAAVRAAPSVAAHCRIVEARRTNASSSAASRTTTAPSAASSWATMSRKFQVFGPKHVGHAVGGGLDHVLAAAAAEAAADEGDRARRPTRRRARRWCRPAGSPAAASRGLAVALMRAALRRCHGDVRLRRAVARRRRSARDGAARGSVAAADAAATGAGRCRAAYCFFRLLRAAGEEDDVVVVDAGESPQLGRARIVAIGLRAVVLERAGDVHATRHARRARESGRPSRRSARRSDRSAAARAPTSRRMRR